MKVRFIEQSAGIKLSNPKVIKILESEMEKVIENQFEELLKKLIEKQSDPFGYGRFYKRTREGRDLTVEEWREMYPEIEVKFNVDLEIIRHGAIS